MFLIEEIMSLSDEELRQLSLQKDKNGRYTEAANTAQMERNRRSGLKQFSGIENRCSKYKADIDYYGWPDMDA